MAVDEAPVDLELDRAHPARMYDYYLGGTTNFPADRAAAGAAMAAFPAILLAARANRHFMRRSTQVLAAAGLRQFLDLGSGIPTSPNLHEVAQSAAPDARVVYTDRDPIVRAHSHALLRSHPAGRTAYVHGDITDPAALLASPALQATLDLARPVAVSLIAVLHFVPGEETAHALVEQLKAAVAPGSTLAVSHGTPDFDPAATARLRAAYERSGTTGRARTRAEFARFLDGWELLPPGITPTHRWRTRAADGFTGAADADAGCWAAVARKP